MKKEILLFLISLYFFQSNAQWQQTSGPLGGKINCIASDGPEIYIGTDHDVFRSSNNGSSWEDTNTNFNQPVRTIAVMGSILFVGTYDEGIYRSVDKGQIWSRANNGLIYRNKFINSITSVGTYLYAGTNDGVYFSSDSGLVWSNITNNLAYPNVMNLCGSGTTIYSSSYGGVNRSTDNGQTWQKIWENSVHSPGASLSSFAADSNHLVVGTLGGGLFYSNDYGMNWKVSKSIFHEVSISAILVKGNQIFASGGHEDGSVYVSNNFGQSWNRYELGFINTEVEELCISGSNIYAATDGGMFLSTNEARTWNPINEGLPIQLISRMIPLSNGIMAGTFTNGMYHSKNNGDTWDQINNGLESKAVYAMIADGMNVYCGTDQGLFLSRDLGKSWISKKSGTPFIWEPLSFAIQDSRIYAGTFDRVIIVSDNNGETWKQYNNEVGFPSNSWSAILSILIEDSVLVAGTSYHGIYTSFDHGISWSNTLMRISTGTAVNYLLRINDKFIAATTEGLYVSDNFGLSWNYSGNGIPSQLEIYSLLEWNGTIYAGTSGGVFQSDNQGMLWKNISQGMKANSSVFELIIKDEYIYAGLYGGSVWKRPLSELVSNDHHQTITSTLTYPNPSDGKFRMLGSEQFETIEVFSMVGERVYYDPNFKQVQNGMIDLSQHPAGIYIIRAKGPSINNCEEIVISK